MAIMMFVFLGTGMTLNMVPSTLRTGFETGRRTSDLALLTRGQWVEEFLLDVGATYVRPTEKVGGCLPHILVSASLTEGESFQRTISDSLSQWRPALVMQ
jgi:hypothetical protein